MGFFDKFSGKAVDPVCKMKVDKAKPPGGTSSHGSETYYFCGPGCKRQFEADPHKWLGADHHH
ncbi:MAG TPA: YHS domain-containing protein [Candidatus Thermoplasmatota archaeon]|nr:YHS domain-containing protein [Candidatus Thermoplasmatota archaeon]